MGVSCVISCITMLVVCDNSNVITGSNGLLVVTDTINGYIRLMTTTGKLLDCIGYEVCQLP